MSVMDVIQSTFNVKEDIKSPFDRDLEFDRLLKYTNYVSLNKKNNDSSNIFKKSKITNMSIEALKNTANYSTKPVEHKLNITK